MNNTGVAGIPLARNSRGHELHLATNLLGPFALTGLLLPLLRRQARSRIVNLGDFARLPKRLELDDLSIR